MRLNYQLYLTSSAVTLEAGTSPELPEIASFEAEMPPTAEPPEFASFEAKMPPTAPSSEPEIAAEGSRRAAE